MPNYISPIQRVVGVGKFRGLHVDSVDVVSRFNGDEWTPESFSPIESGNTSQWIRWKNGHPTDALTFAGTATRYWDIYIQASPPVRQSRNRRKEIFNRGSVLATAPEKVLGASIIYHDVLQREFLVAVCRQTEGPNWPNLDEFFALDLSEEIPSWVSCGTFRTGNREPYPDIFDASDSFRQNDGNPNGLQNLTCQGSWFFNASGSRAVTLREFSSTEDLNLFLHEGLTGFGQNFHYGFLQRFDLLINQQNNIGQPFSVAQIPQEIERVEIVDNKQSFQKTIAVDFDGDDLKILKKVYRESESFLDFTLNGTSVWREPDHSFNQSPEIALADLRAGGFFVQAPFLDQNKAIAQIYDNGIFQTVRGL